MRFRTTMFATAAAAAAAMMSSSALATTCSDLAAKYAAENAKNPVVYRSVLQGKRAAIYRDMSMKARQMDEKGDAKGCVSAVERMQAMIKAQVEKDKAINKSAWANAKKNRIGNGVSVSQFKQSDLSKDTFVGRSVYDAEGEPVGVVDDYVVVGEDSYILVTPVNFMGGTEKYRVVPVKTVKIVKDEGSVILPLKASQFTTTETVESAKYLTTQEAGDWLNKNNGYYQSNSAFGQ